MFKIFKGLAILVACVLPSTAQAQIQDSVFADYESYVGFVDEKIATSDFGELVKVLGGRDEYTKEQLAQIVRQFQQALPKELTNKVPLRRDELKSGFSKEAYAYWAEDTLQYVYFYALLHQRENELIVLQFNLNTDIETILDKF